MATNKLQWRRIAKGEKLPCQSFLRKKNGEILKLSTGAGVTVGQDAYYLPIDEVIEEIKNYPIEESEDERIRKAILELVRQSSEILEKKNQEQMIAWLEKQGEHANFRNKIQIGDKVTRNEDGVLVNLSQLNRVAKKDEKQGEQKPMKTCAEYYNKDSELKMPELSVFQNKLADILMQREYEGSTETEKDIARARLDYELAAIRISEELLPLAIMQNSAEWSEEDKKLIDDTCHLINKLASGYGEKVTEPITLSGTQMIASIKDRLRALVDNRSQNHWRPSETQMSMLRAIINEPNNSGSESCHLAIKSLYDDLSKLK